MTILPLLGLIAGSCFAYAAIPTAVRTIRAGKSLGTPLDIIITILAGTALMFVYLTASYGFNTVLAINYGIEALSWAVLLFYRLKS